MPKGNPAGYLPNATKAMKAKKKAKKGAKGSNPFVKAMQK
jgi:hypothetical protein